MNEKAPEETKIEYDELGFVKDYVCPRCGDKVKLSYEDDVGSKFFKCEKCGEYSHKLKTKQKESFEKQIEAAGWLLHPAGGLTDTFVYEPLDTSEYVYRTIDDKSGIARVNVEYEDPKKKKGKKWFILVEGATYYFTKKPPKEWLFNIPNRATIKKWIEGKKQSLPLDKLWNLNGVYLRTFLDFPHKHEFSVSQLKIIQSWLVEILPVVFYLGIKGEFGGGKTVTGESIVLVSRHGYLTGNLSPPFVARTIQEQKVTLMVDELDSVAGPKDSDLNSVFRQGYRRGSRYSRVNPDTLEPESFDIFSDKLFTIHTEIEEALQTRTIPIHIRETSEVEYPIVNLDKTSFANMVYTENFLWYLDNILRLRNNQFEKLQSISNASVDMVDVVDLLVRGVPSEATSELMLEKAEKVRDNIYQKKRGLLTEGQLGQLCQLAGRNTELMYLCFVLSNVIGVNCDDVIKKTFEQKIVEEGERTELGYLGLLRDVLSTLWKQKNGLPEYTTEDGLTKISNKEIYDKYNEQLKNTYGQGVSPPKFKEYMLEFGFTDALNRTKLKVPIPDDLEPKSRLCNIFASRVLRKLGINAEEAAKEHGKEHKFNILAETRLGVCELCGEPETLTHSFVLGSKIRYACSLCAKGDVF